MKTKYAISFLFLLGIFNISNAQLSGSGNAYDFQVNHVSVPNNAAFNSSTAITVEAWIKSDSWAPNIWENVIVSTDSWANGTEGYSLRSGDGGNAVRQIVKH